MDAATLATIASVISAFGAAMLFFRIQRELSMKEQGEQIWLPRADWLLVVATLLCLLLVIVPLVLFSNIRLPAAAAGSAAIMVAGYVLAILAHYRIFFGRQWLFWGNLRPGPRDNPEPAELILSVATWACAALFFILRLLSP
jgi:amino acid transporter